MPPKKAVDDIISDWLEVQKAKKVKYPGPGKSVSDYLRLPSEETELGSRKSIPKDALIRLLTGARAGYEDVYSQMGYEDPVAAFDALIELINSGEILSYIAQWNDPAVQNPPTLKGSPFDVKGRYKEAGETDIFVDILEPTAKHIKEMDESYATFSSGGTYQQQVIDPEGWGDWGTVDEPTGVPLAVHGPLWIGKSVLGDYEKESIGVPWFPATGRPTGQEALDVGYTPNIAMFNYPPENLEDMSYDDWIDMAKKHRKTTESAVADMNPDSVFIRGETGLLPFIDPERWVKIPETNKDKYDRFWRNIEATLHEFRHVDPITGEPISHGSEMDIEGADKILMDALRAFSAKSIVTSGPELDLHELYKELGFKGPPSRIYSY